MLTQEHLEALTISESTRKDDGNGVSWEVASRQLTLDDVLSYREDGDTMVIVTKDGRKISVWKEAIPGNAVPDQNDDAQVEVGPSGRWIDSMAWIIATEQPLSRRLFMRLFGAPPTRPEPKVQRSAKSQASKAKKAVKK